MKVTRYSASGSTHRNGAEAMFWVMWLVTESSRAEPIAESRIHCASATADSGATGVPVSAVTGVGATLPAPCTAALVLPAAALVLPAAALVLPVAAPPRIEYSAVAPHTTTNSAYSPDQAQPACTPPSHGSTSTG